MRAAVMRHWELSVDEVPDPVPQSGQALTRVLACGICGSDLHVLQHGAEQLSLRDELAAENPPDPLAPQPFEADQAVVMGHEFCCEVVELGPGCENLAVGDVVVSMPAAIDATGVHAIGYSNRYPGGYGELLVVNDLLALKVPAGVPARAAALTEPLAVGAHAVAKSAISSSDAAVVLGCGPVGLAIIADLARRGVGPIVASDFSPARRRLAEHLGAHEVVDPATDHVMAAWRRVDGVRPVAIFEAVGVPGMLEACMRMAPKGTRITVVGVCLQADALRPAIGIYKELSLQFVLGYEPHEFAGSLLAIAEGDVELDPLVTSTVAIDGVPKAFGDLAHPDEHVKILVEP